MSTPPSRGKTLQEQLLRNLRALQRGFTAPKRVRPVLWDVTSSGTFVNDMNLDIFLARATEIVLESGRVYRWEDTVVYEFRNPGNQRLRVLSAGEEPARHAANILCNLFAVGVQTEIATHHRAQGGVRPASGTRRPQPYENHVESRTKAGAIAGEQEGRAILPARRVAT
jgi:hypothetical protein